MPYVMVPVPEEHVGEILRHVVRLLGEQETDALLPWDPEQVARFFADAGEDGRALLALLAHPDHAGRDISVREASRSLEMLGQGLSGVLGPLSKRARRAYGRSPLVDSRKVAGAGVEGGRSLYMDPEIAGWVRDAEADFERRSS